MMKKVVAKKIGFELKKVRISLNLTQEIVAESLNITIKHLSEIERSLSNPSLELFSKIINYYNSHLNSEIDLNKIFYE